MSASTVPYPLYNRTFKDTVFRDLFGDESRKAYSLSLYNALNGTSYDDPDALELTTITGALYIGYRNDVSFIIGDDMVLWEHQSTHNPNMPLRGLFYFTELYSQYITTRGFNRFSKKLIPLPAPQYYVFYTGRRQVPERQEMRLSDAFFGGAKGDVEVCATVLRIDEHSNGGILRACQALAGYAHLLGLARSFMESMPPAEALRAAVDRCIADGYLTDYLTARKDEVVGMLLDAYTEEEYYRCIEQEAIEQGLEQGRKQGLEQGRQQGLEQGLEQGREQGRELERLDVARSLIADGILDAEAAAARFGIPIDKLCPSQS